MLIIIIIIIVVEWWCALFASALLLQQPAPQLTGALKSRKQCSFRAFRVVWEVRSVFVSVLQLPSCKARPNAI